MTQVKVVFSKENFTELDLSQGRFFLNKEGDLCFYYAGDASVDLDEWVCWNFKKGMVERISSIESFPKSVSIEVVK